MVYIKLLSSIGHVVNNLWVIRGSFRVILFLDRPKSRGSACEKFSVSAQGWSSSPPWLVWIQTIPHHAGQMSLDNRSLAHAETIYKYLLKYLYNWTPKNNTYDQT